jgi:hypothetical protein
MRPLPKGEIMQVQKKTAIKVVVVSSVAAYYYHRSRNRNKITLISPVGFDPEAYKAVQKQMLNEIEFGVYDDVPFSQDNFDAIFKMKLELYAQAQE